MRTIYSLFTALDYVIRYFLVFIGRDGTTAHTGMNFMGIFAILLRDRATTNG